VTYLQAKSYRIVQIYVSVRFTFAVINHQKAFWGMLPTRIIGIIPKLYKRVSPKCTLATGTTMKLWM